MHLAQSDIQIRSTCVLISESFLPLCALSYSEYLCKITSLSRCQTAADCAEDQFEFYVHTILSRTWQNDFSRSLQWQSIRLLLGSCPHHELIDCYRGEGFWLSVSLTQVWPGQISHLYPSSGVFLAPGSLICTLCTFNTDLHRLGFPAKLAEFNVLKLPPVPVCDWSFKINLCNAMFGTQFSHA